MSGEGEGRDEDLLRARERDAMTALALAQLPNEDEVRTALLTHHDYAPPPLVDAVQTLVEIGRHRRRSYRTHALQLLVKAVARHGTGIVADVPALGDLLFDYVEEGRERHLVADAPPPAPPKAPGGPPLATTGDPAVDAVLRGLELVAANADVEMEPWDTFATNAGAALELEPEEVDLPRCHDSLGVRIDGRQAVRLQVSFRTRHDGAGIGKWTNPANWSKASLWFEDMRPSSGGAPPAGEDFQETFTEVVRISDSLVLTTDLQFTRQVHPGSLWVCRFRLPGGPTDQLGVDTGNIVVRHDPDLPPPHQVEVQTEKYLEFLDPALQAWPTIACDLFWTELCIHMALGFATGLY